LECALEIGRLKCESRVGKNPGRLNLQGKRCGLQIQGMDPGHGGLLR